MTKADQVLQALRANGETKSTDADGSVWFSVYLDNARPGDMNDKSFRSCLAALAKKGLYRPLDGYAFGDVKMEAGR